MAPEALRRLEGQLKDLREKHPGIIVDRRSWFSGPGGDAFKGQIEKLLRSLDESKLPKEEAEKLRKELENAKREAVEAMEQARRAVEDAMKAVNGARKPEEQGKF